MFRLSLRRWCRKGGCLGAGAVPRSSSQPGTHSPQRLCAPCPPPILRHRLGREESRERIRGRRRKRRKRRGRRRKRGRRRRRRRRRRRPFGRCRVSRISLSPPLPPSLSPSPSISVTPLRCDIRLAVAVYPVSGPNRRLSRISPHNPCVPCTSTRTPHEMKGVYVMHCIVQGLVVQVLAVYPVSHSKQFPKPPVCPASQPTP